MSSTRTTFSLACKRGADILVSGTGLIGLSPVLITIAILIKLTSRGPVLYNADRIGIHGQSIKVRKFRTMVANASRMGAGVTMHADPRITTMGRFLRNWKLDELPQLLNVFEGSMSLVGPRPEDPRYVALYTPEQRHVLDVRPGITSPASLEYRHEEQMLLGVDSEQFYIRTVMPAKLEIELRYIDTAGFRQDISILLRTLLALFR